MKKILPLVVLASLLLGALYFFAKTNSPSADISPNSPLNKTKYTLHDLGPGYIRAINSSGDTLITRQDNSTYPRLTSFLYKPSTKQMLKLSEAISAPEPNGADINDKGDIVGDYDGYAFMYKKENGKISQLKFPQNPTFTHAHAVNNKGQIAGWGWFNNSQTLAFRAEADGTTKVLDQLKNDNPDPFNYYNFSQALGINNQGDVIGLSRGKAFVYTDDKGLIDLGSGTPYAINDERIVLMIGGFGSSTSWYYNITTGQKIATPTLPSRATMAGMGEDKSILGGTATRAFMITPQGVITYLDSLATNLKSWKTTTTQFTTTSGIIAGSGKKDDGVTRAFLLVPTTSLLGR